MEIKNVTSYLVQALEKPKEAPGRVTGEEKSAGSGREVTATPDRVELSKSYQEMAQAKKVMMNRDDIRTDRVDQVRTSIANGSYQVQPEKIAGSMLDEFV